MEPLMTLADELGPFKIIQVQQPSMGLNGVLVVDNVAMGPSIGGVRMAADVTMEECMRLARAMTFKNAAAGIPHGGGKAVLKGDPGMPMAQKEQLIRGFACALREVEQYIFAPDMGTNEVCMGWVKDEINRVVALPRELGGIPLDEIGATGWGLRHAIEAALPFCDFGLAGARFAVQGFGAVGMHVSRFLAEQGAQLVAAADSHGAIHNPEGLDVQRLVTLKGQGHPLHDYPDARQITPEQMLAVECEIWIPAARPDVINETNMRSLNTRMVAEGANIPITAAAERFLHEQGVLCLPDFIANAGGVICAAMEYQGSTETAALQTIEEKVRRNTREVLEQAAEQRITPRDAALQLARTRLGRAMDSRRWRIF